MQSSPINAAQLMMEFLNKEQTDIGQGIVVSEFSRELENQQLKLGETAQSDARLCSQEKLSPAFLQSTASMKSPRTDTDSTSENGTTRKLKILKRLVADEEPQKDDRSQIAQEMFLSNPGHLEKVLADLKVPAEVRKVCKASEDKGGRLSLHDLLAVLEQQTTNPAILNPGQATGQDVAILVNSVVISEGRELLNVEKLIKKPNGAYALDELRQVIEKAVEQIRTNRLGRSAVSLESSGSAASSRLSTSTLTERSTSTAAPDQSSHLVNSTIPSFVEEISRNKGRDQQEEGTPTDIRVRDSVEVGVSESRAQSPAGKINTSERELPPTLTTESENRRLETAMSQFNSSGMTVITEGNPHDLIQALMGTHDHREEVPLRAVGDVLKGFVEESTAGVLGQSKPVDILEQLQVILPLCPEGTIKGKIWPTASEPISSSSKIKEYFTGLPRGEDQAQTRRLHLVSSSSACEKTMTSMDSRNNPLHSEALLEGFSRMSRNNRTHPEVEKEGGSVEEVKASPAVSTSKAVVGQLAEHTAQLASSTREAVGEINGEKPVPASLATTLENQSSTLTRAASGQFSEAALSSKESSGQEKGMEGVKVTAKSIQNVSLPNNAGSGSESIPRIQTAEYLSRLDGIPLETGRRSSAWNRVDPSKPDMPSIGSEESSRSVKNDWKIPPSQPGGKAASQSIQAAAGSAFEHKQPDGGRSSTRFSDAGDPATANYPAFMQNTPTANEAATQFGGDRMSILHPSWTQEMVQVIQNLLKGKRTTQLTLELEPRDLGHLTLRVGTSNEEVTAYVSAEKEQARELLLRNVSVLRQQLEDQGLTLGRFMVDVQDGRQDGNHFRGRESHENNLVSPHRIAVEKEADQPDSGFQTINSSEKRLISLFA